MNSAEKKLIIALAEAVLEVDLNVRTLSADDQGMDLFLSDQTRNDISALVKEVKRQ